MSNTVQIRAAVEADAELIAGLFDQLGYPGGSHEMRARLTLVLRDPGHWCAVAVTEDVVGCCHIFCVPILEAGLVAQLGGLVVDSAYRGRGIGSDLLAAAELWATDRGCCSVYVRSNVIRKAAHSFYQRAGYHNSKTQFAFRKRLSEPNQPSEPTVGLRPSVAHF